MQEENYIRLRILHQAFFLHNNAVLVSSNYYQHIFSLHKDKLIFIQI